MKEVNKMKTMNLAVAAMALVASTSVNAAFIKSGYIVTDLDTGLEWLDLAATTSVSYNNALSLANSNYGGGWDYAQQDDVEALIFQFFPNYLQTHQNNDGGYERCTESEPCYSGSRLQAAVDFFDLFGTYTETDQVSREGAERTYYGMSGLVASPEGAYTDLALYGAFRVDTNYGEDYTHVFIDNFTYDSDSSHSTWIVRDVSAVPIPSVVWLFGSGLLGLIGVARRKARA